ncbi:hypothetical protein K6Y31_20660 [Motilimonas cestriensis]|uniref:Uncharacterized protein n=1 Tax=Motilimonas cestriensis TaxID=2742685 RepID=A0ABS8WDS3_9GAMM|nr:hypothetical protein [Motilimonas cestriensis]MCE2597189.1 hypothetical protein [Motilimonas cestriensis]
MDVNHKKNNRTGKKTPYSAAVNTILDGLGKKKIPEPSRHTIDKLGGYEAKPFLLKSLNDVDCRQRDSQKRVRVRMIQVLRTIVTYVDWSTFRVGVAKPDELDPVKHTAMRHRYNKIYGEQIAESTWFRYIDKLVRAGYLTSQAMSLRNSEGVIRGVAGYKWFTLKFFTELGFKKGWIDNQRNLALARLNDTGLSNHWPTYASKVARQKRAEAITLENYQTGSAQGEFDSWWEVPEVIPLAH